MSRLLELEEITRQLGELPGWVHEPLRLRASYTAPDVPSASRLVAEVLDEAEQMDHHPDIDLRWRTVTFTCSTHSAGGITQLDVELAHRVARCAAQVGARRTSAPGRFELAVDAVDVDRVRAFWKRALGYVEVRLPHGDVELRDPHGLGPALWFQRMDPPRTDRNRIHLDSYFPTAATAREALSDLEALGGRLVDGSHAPAWLVVADCEGNEVCLCTEDRGT